ncbi:hypothetical protein [Arenicella xantha]|uniref:Uncharacterized protein n=1 Tax=Arenicella xantha TaxID=644221 RepID=A0A395JQ70_9GAMM|nr:hypothetical protein [Arenicella xantha]RBP51684.1 hypothetical protein DFR28_1021116 [Arenicella xantha]
MSGAENNQRRVFKTPIIVPLSVVMVIAIYAGYVFFYATSEETGFFAYLKMISFEVFLLCEVGMVALILYNKRQLDRFLVDFPAIENRIDLAALKPIVRTNMYSSLFMIFFLALGSLTAIMSILNHGIIRGVLVAASSIATAMLINWYNPSEQKLKHIECTNDTLEVELNNILQCWMHKPFPNF